ncbi:MAG: motility associated factor glycosyltransferase family protein [Phycisphaeraceae bacterium]|nr:motility associated factor glycosyltransferase family protein [Phycisphaeraceae bacterium]
MTSLLEKNLRTLSIRHAPMAELVRSASPSPLSVMPSRKGPITATAARSAATEPEISADTAPSEGNDSERAKASGRGIAGSSEGDISGGGVIQLASRFDPEGEAVKLVSTIEARKSAVVVVLGFGLGYHIRQVLKTIGPASACVVYEPDIALVRAVLEIADCSDFLADERLMIMLGSVDRGEVVQRMEPLTVLALQGTVILHHPPSRSLRERELAAFAQAVTGFLGYGRMHLSTMIVNATRTVSNYLGNFAGYAAGLTTDGLKDAARGYPAVCISAGPSLARNVHLLANPEWRKRVVVISAQTTLKYLLARGITPDYVTALDYSSVSTRFYEGLPPLEDCTLVVEPMVHPSVPAAYPGPVRMTQSSFLNSITGDNRWRYDIRYGATVAHLSFYLAQHLGCDPILFIGQDLGFTDGLYYCPGSPIHDVWMPEINPFNTLEMMEWRRVVACRPLLVKVQDQRGMPMYQDEQMSTYLKQFERDFLEAEQQVIDCTEGGAAKLHSRVMGFEEALRRYARKPLLPLPRASNRLDPLRLAHGRRMYRRRRAELDRLLELSLRTVELLKRLREKVDETDQYNRLVRRIDACRAEVMGMKETFGMIEEFNAIGVFNRFKADRQLAARNTDPSDREHRISQVDRDLSNVQWIIEACREAIRLFDEHQKDLGQAEGQAGRRTVDAA